MTSTPVLRGEQLDGTPEVVLTVAQVGADTDESSFRHWCYVRRLEASRGHDRVRELSRSPCRRRRSPGRTLARELAPYRAGLVLAKPGAGPALREAGAVKIASALPIWRVPTRSALQVLPGLLRSDLVTEVTPDQPLSTLQAPPAEGTDWWIPFVHADGAVPPGPGQAADDHRHRRRPDARGVRRATRSRRRSTGRARPARTRSTGPQSPRSRPRRGTTLGVVGVYPQANLYLWDASPSGLGITAGDVIRGLDAAIHLGPGVVNLSLGSRDQEPADRPDGRGHVKPRASSSWPPRGTAARTGTRPSTRPASPMS